MKGSDIMADKKNRQVGSVDVAVIKENINNSKNIKNKEARYLFATRLNSLLEESSAGGTFSNHK